MSVYINVYAKNRKEAGDLAIALAEDTISITVESEDISKAEGIGL
jgi:hypothetical protein